MNIQPVISNCNSINLKYNFKAATLSSATRQIPVSKIKESINLEELNVFVEKLKNVKNNILIKLSIYSSKSMQTYPRAKMLAEKLYEVNSVLDVLAPNPKNTLKQKV